MNYALFFARRLSLSGNSQKKAPAVSVAITAIALSIGIMIASIAIVLGFKKEIRDKVVGFNGHITLYSSPLETDDDNILTLTPSLKEILNNTPFILDYSLQAAIPAILKTQNDFKGVYLKGLNGNITTDFIKRNLSEGSLPDFSKNENKEKIVISQKAANQLSLRVGDKIDTYFISDDVRVRRLEVAGIYNTHFEQYDDVILYGSLSLVQRLGQINDDQGTYLQISTDNFDNLSQHTFALQQSLNKALAEGEVFKLYKTENVLNQGAGFFSWLNLLDTNVSVVLILMLIVSCVSLVSGMFIIIIEKKRFIGIFRALGAPIGEIRKIFVFLSMKIAVIGMLVGNILTISLLILQQTYHFLPLDPESYYIDFVPVNLSIGSILSLNLGVLIIVYCVLILPAGIVARIAPSETMKAE